MDLSNYLEKILIKLIVNTKEELSIQKEGVTLENGLNIFFNYDKEKVLKHFLFGSYIRNTLISKEFDNNSDIDFLIVFKNIGNDTHIYINELENFVTKNYSINEIKKLNSKILLEVEGIKIDLIPALQINENKYKIPDFYHNIKNWITIDPKKINETLIQKNLKTNLNLIKIIQLLKYWNAAFSCGFHSYKLAENIINKNFYSYSNLQDYLFGYFLDLKENIKYPESLNQEISKVHKIIEQIRYNTISEIEAEKKIKEIIPDPDIFN